MLECRNMSKKYDSNENVIMALDHVSLTIKKGEFLAVVGPSGSGKSTLLHILSGLDIPTEGEVLFHDKNIFEMQEKVMAQLRCREFGFVFQKFCLLPMLTAKENIIMPILLDHQKVDISFLEELSKQLGISERLEHFPNELSGGQQQRVAIARALIAKPEVVFADEPTGNLDSVHGREVINLLVDSTKKYGKTLVMITHDKSLADRADRKIEILDGKIVKEAFQ